MPDIELISYVAVGATPEKKQEAMRVLGALDMRVQGQEAVKALWADDPPEQMPDGIEVQFTPPKKN